MIANTTSRNILKYILLLSSIEYISNVRADNQCTSNLDCAKFNTEVDSHVCIRWDGQKDYVCYLEAEAYCTTDASCQGFNEALKFCYVPPWITNKNSQKQCFTIHSEGGTCLEDSHCNEGLICSNNVCTASTGENNSNNANGKVGTAGTAGNANSNDKINNKNTNSTTNANSNKKPSNKNTNSTSTLDLDYDDEEKKDEPIEIIGLPLWGFITVCTVPVVFLVVILWGLSIGRKSYREEEERKRNKMVLKNNEKELDTKYNGVSSERLIPDSTSDYKGDMLKSYLNTGDGNGSGAITSISSSSNSTIANNLNLLGTAGTATTPVLNNKSSQATLETQKLRKNKKSNTNLAGAAVKPKKPKSIVNSEYSDTNSHQGLLAAGTGFGMSAADSGIYSNYFGGGGASSTVSSNYFGQAVPTDPMNAIYYQQMLAAQQLQAQQLQNQALMNQYYMGNAGVMGGMPSVDMMQYQQLYGQAMMNGGIVNNQMLYAGSDVGSSSDAAPKKTKHKK